MLGETLSLRPPVQTEFVEPLSVAPDPGKMSQIYIDLRVPRASGGKYFPDGMSMACAVPKRDYQDIVHDYTEQRIDEQDADAAFAFWEANFDTPEPEKGLFAGAEGTSIDEYTLKIRERFIFPTKARDKGFDLWLPYNRSVAGAGRFGKHSFLWDGYHMAKGYAADGRWDLVQDITDNTEYQINRFNYPLNGSADFYATRPQIPYFSHEVRLMADHFGPEALIRYRPAMEKEYRKYWMEGKARLGALPYDGEAHEDRTLVRMPDGSFLNRYWDDGDGPRLESLREDVNLGNLVINGLKHATHEEREKRRQKLYKDVRAAAASGWDFSSRWFADGRTMETINTTDIIPVDLNSLLEYTEETLAMAYATEADLYANGVDPAKELQLRIKASEYWNLACQRTEAMNKYLLNPATQVFHDYNYVNGNRTGVISAASAYPLYVGMATAEQTFGTAQMIQRDLLRPAGVATTANHGLDTQWDGEERVWAPTNWAVARGLARMAHILMEEGVDAEWLLDLSEEAKNNYEFGIEAVYGKHRIVPEKHHGRSPTILTGGGEYELVEALGMSGETYRAMKAWNPREPDKVRPIGRVTMRAIGRASVRLRPAQVLTPMYSPAFV